MPESIEYSVSSELKQFPFVSMNFLLHSGGELMRIYLSCAWSQSFRMDNVPAISRSTFFFSSLSYLLLYGIRSFLPAITLVSTSHGIIIVGNLSRSRRNVRCISRLLLLIFMNASTINIINACIVLPCDLFRISIISVNKFKSKIINWDSKNIHLELISY